MRLTFISQPISLVHFAIRICFGIRFGICLWPISSRISGCVRGTVRSGCFRDQFRSLAHSRLPLLKLPLGQGASLQCLVASQCALPGRRCCPEDPRTSRCAARWSSTMSCKPIARPCPMFPACQKQGWCPQVKCHIPFWNFPGLWLINPGVKARSNSFESKFLWLSYSLHQG